MGLEGVDSADALLFEDVTFSYDGADSPAVSHVSLRIERGSCVVLTGRSGCGKTTLTRMMNGLIPVVYEGRLEGRVFLLGRPMGQWRIDEVPESVGSVFQNPRSQFVNMDTTSEVAFGCESLGVPQEEIVKRVGETARSLGIEHLLDKRVEALSGGQRQMVILASACATHPDVYVLDEPTASLDAASMRQLGKALSDLKAQGKTIVVSEHRLWWLADVADRVVYMEKGEVSGDWTSEEFAAIPLHTRKSLGLRAWSIAEIRQNEPARADALRDFGGTGVEARAIRVGYCGSPGVLDGLSFCFKPGRAVALLGCNGAGKTTLARCLSGLSRESVGTVLLDGADAPYRKRAGAVYLVMQEPGYQLFETSVLDEMRESARKMPPSLVDGAARETLEALGLSGLEERHPLSLSGGERQRLSIGAGLLFGAKAMILDEPTSGLDYLNMVNVARQIDRMKDRGMSVCIITHDYEFLCASCDEAALLEGGRIVESRPISPDSLPWVRERFGF